MKFLILCGFWLTLLGPAKVVSGPSSFEPTGNFKFAIKDYVYGSPWPKPAAETKENILFALDPSNFMFDSSQSEQQSDVLTEAVKRYKPLTFPDAKRKPASDVQLMLSLQINVQEPMQPLNLSTDESYTLAVDAPHSMLSANTIWGVLRGLETFSQLVYQNESGSYFAQKNKVTDYPRFNHRGFLIDTSRHYVALPVIYQFLDAMAWSKFNVFHWHIVDADAFPYVSKRFPQLHQRGAFNNRTHIYTPKDVQNVIEYARMRGIRVLPEFDTPGHSDSWFSIENFLTPCYSGGKPNGNYGPVNPTVESNYEFLHDFFEEVTEVFPDKYIHMGGDEVSFACWKSNPDIAKWMEEHDMGKNYSLLEQYYEQRLLDIVGKLGKGYVIWQEVVDNKVKVQDDTVVNIWKGHGDEWKAEAQGVTSNGYTVILSSPWYLNYIAYAQDWHKVQQDTVVNVWRGGWQQELSKVTGLQYHAILSSPWYLNYISYAQDWHKYYSVDPQDFSGSAGQKKLVIGGTACMWGEWVDATNLISRTWARGLSVGERLWSPASVKDLTDATKRIWEHRCRYVRRGLPAENVVDSQYCRHEWMNEAKEEY